MLDTEYDEEKVMALFKEDGKREERVNTEREKKRADAAEERADAAEEEVRKLKELLAKNNITVE